jgi:hypothetical protein
VDWDLVRLNVDATGTHAPLLLAEQNDWCQDEGLDVSFGEGNGSDSTVALIDAGNDDIGIAGFDAVAGVPAKGPRETTEAERAEIRANARTYLGLQAANAKSQERLNPRSRRGQRRLSVGVCLRNFEACTCHTQREGLDQRVCRSEALRRSPRIPLSYSDAPRRGH